MTLAAIFLYKPLTLPGNEIAWKTIATLPFVIIAATCLVRYSSNSNLYLRRAS